MSQIVKLRRSSVSGQKPTNTNLQLGELALNTTDGKVYMAKSGSLGPSVEELISTNTINTGSVNISGSINLEGIQTISGSLFVSGTISGSALQGDGSGIINIPLSGVTNLTTISSSFDNRINQITGSVDSLNTFTSSVVLTSQTSSMTVLSASYAVTAAFALNAGSGGSGGASLGSYTLLDQTIAATTWSFAHNTGQRYPIFQVFNSDGDVIIPTQIRTIDDNNAEIIFGSAQTGTAIASLGGGNGTTQEFTNSALWTVDHNLGTDYPDVTIWDSNRNIIFPNRIESVDSNQIKVYFSVPVSGHVSVSRGGHILSGSGGVSSWNDLQDIPSGLVSSSSQISYTSISNIPSGIVSGSEQLTGSYDTRYVLSGSITQTTWDNIANKPAGIVSASVQVELTGTTGYSTFSSSIATTDLNQNNRLNSLESTSSSLLLLSSSIDTALEFTGSNVTIKGDFLVKGTTTTVNSTTLDIGDNIISLNGTGATNAGLVVRDVTNPNTVSGSLLWDSTNDYWVAGALGSEEKILLVGEFNTYTSSIDSIIDGINSTTNSLNSYTASTNLRIDSLETESGSIRGDFNSYTSSNNSRLNSLETESGSIRTDFHSFTSSYTTSSFTGSFIGDGSGLTNLSNITGSVGQVAILSSDKTVSGSSFTYVTNQTFGLGTNAVNNDSPERLMVDNFNSYNIATFQTSQQETYAEVNIKNFGSGSSSSADLVIWNDVSTPSSSFLNLGINSSNYNAGYVGYGGDGYLFNHSNDLYLGSMNSIESGHGHVHIFGGGMWDSSSISIYSDGTIGINTDKENPNASTIPSSGDGYAVEISGSVNFRNGMFVTGSVVISGSLDISDANVGGSRYLHTQASTSATWSITHNLGYDYPNVTVYDGSNNKVMLPADVTSVDANTTEVTFATPEYGYALVSVGGISTSSADRYLHTQSSATGSWVIDHNIGYKYVTINVYDQNDEQLIPQKITAVSVNRTQIDFVTPTSGNAIITVGGPRSTSIFTQTGSFYTTQYDIGITGSLVVTGEVDASSFNTTSDKLLKTNLERIEGALDKIEQLNGYTFDWIDDYSYDKTRQIGMIANEVHAVQPELTSKRTIMLNDKQEDILLLDYSKVTVLLIEAVKELSDKVKKLEEKLNKK